MNTQIDVINSQFESSSKKLPLKRANKYGQREEIASVSIIALVFITLLFFSWHRWTGLIIDSGRELDLPLRLLRGELLYRDVYYLYAPLSPYFNALLYKVFGANLNVLQMSGIFFSIVLTTLCYRISRRLLSPAESAIAVSAIVIICIFKPGGNLIQPYAFAALHGTVLSLATLLMIVRFIETTHKRELILAGIFLGLAFITKLEFALAALAAIFASLLFLTQRDKEYKGAKIFSPLCIVGFFALLISLPVYAWFFYKVDASILIKDCHLFYTHIPQSLVIYNLQRTGMDRPLFSLLQMLGGGAVLVTSLLFIVVVSLRKSEFRLKFKIALLITLFVIIIVAINTGKLWDGSPFRALPLLLIALIIGAWKLRNRVDDKTRAYIFVIGVYALAILGRVSLRVPSGGAFGGFFLPTSLILFCYLYFRLLPEYLRNKTNDRFIALKAKTIGQVLLIVSILAVGTVYCVRFRKNYSYELTEPNGHLYVSRKTGPALEQAMAFIQTETKPSDSIAIFPEGSEMAFLTGRKMPLRIQIYHPGFMNKDQELNLIGKIKHNHLQYVFVIDRPMIEFGAGDFGTDYYEIIGKWLSDKEYKIFGSLDGFHIKAYKNKK